MGARYSASCYGDSSLCAALLTARNGKEFQRLLSSMSMPAGRKLFATGLGAPKVGTKPLLAKSARAQGSRNVALQMSVGLQLPNLDFTGKKVAIFGVGDSGSYSDNFCDATGELYECFTKQGAEIIGGTSADDGFDYTESKGVVDGNFVGQVFDEDNYYDASEERANAWVEQLKGEGLPA